MSSCGRWTAATGTINWKRPMAAATTRSASRTCRRRRRSPTAQTVWVMTGAGILKAFDFSGKELWSRDIQKDYGRIRPQLGLRVVAAAARGRALRAGAARNEDRRSVVRDARSTARAGKTLWRVERPTDAMQESPDSYTTPALLEYGSTKKSSSPAGMWSPGTIRRPARSSGAPTASTRTRHSNYRIIASPLVAGGLVIAPTRVRPMLAIKPGGRGDVTARIRAWTFDRGPDVPTPVSDGKLLYSVDDRGVVHALDVKTGAVVYGPERLKPATYSASPVARRRQDLRDQRGGLDVGVRRRPEVRGARGEPVEGVHAQHDCRFEGTAVPATEKFLYAIGKK